MDNQGLIGQVQEETILRSNQFLSIGIHRKTGRAFVEDKNSGETWVWNWREVMIADLSPFSPGKEASLGPVTPYSIMPTEAGFALEYRETWGRLRCSVELSDADVLFRVEPEVLTPCTLSAVRFPSTLSPEKDARPIVLDTVNGGRLHRPSSGGLDFSIEAEQCWMRFYGVLGCKSAYLSILEPGFDALLTYEAKQSGPLGFGWVHTPSLGSLQQARTQRFRFLSSSSYVMAARAYRRYAMKEGFYRSLRDKLMECPSLEKLFGAVLVMIGYLQDPRADYAKAFRQLKKAGVEKAYVYPVGSFNFNGSDDIYPGYRPDMKWVNLNPGILKDLRGLDYLFAPWIWIKETVESSPFCDGLMLRQADGSGRPAWQVGPIRWFANHEGRVLDKFRDATLGLRDKYNAAHFDGNSGPCLENFGNWRYDRKAESEFRNSIFCEFSTRDRVVSCNNKDWALPYMHFGTNKQPGPYGKDAPYWPIPLWQLAFHDAAMTTWWEHSTYNDPQPGHDFSGREIRKRALLDILTGDLPSVSPIGRHLGWRNSKDGEREMFIYDFSFDDPVTSQAIAAAVEVAKFNSLHSTDDLIHHEFLSEDGLEQQTAFQSGTQVRIRQPLPGVSPNTGELKVF